MIGVHNMFTLNPKLWFKDEKEKKRYVIESTLTGESKERALAELDLEGMELQLVLLDLDRKYKNMSEYEYDIAKVKIQEKDELERNEKLAEVDFKHGKTTEVEFRKAIADLHDEPFVHTDIEYDDENPGTGAFVLDYNKHFVDYLLANGYSGEEEDDIVGAWFNDICKSVALEDLEDDDGVAKSYLADSMEGKLIQRTRVDDNFSEYT